jgi:predicted HTH domain antitoxin
VFGRTRIEKKKRAISENKLDDNETTTAKDVTLFSSSRASLTAP